MSTVSFVGVALPDNNSNVEATPQRRKIPQQVQLRINNINTVISWATFISLLNCCHSFETNIFPSHVRSEDVEVTLL